MASLVERRRARAAMPEALVPEAVEERSALSLAEWAEWFSYAGNRYALNGLTTYGPQERVVFEGASPAIASNGVVYAAVAARAALFSEARFVWRRFGAGPKATAADIFTDGALASLDAPRRLLVDLEMQVAQAGNAFIARFGDRLAVLPAQWCTLVLGSRLDAAHPDSAPDSEVIGLLYEPTTGEPHVFAAGEFAHYRPTLPDPYARFRGMSYLRPVLGDAAADNQAREYVQAFYRNAATPNLVIRFPPEMAKQTIEVFRDLFLEKHQGAANAFRTAFLGGGADPVVVGSSLKDLDQVNVTKGLQSMITVASGVPDIILGVLSGHESSTYANYSMAMRRFADITVRPMWGHVAESLRPLFRAPSQGGRTSAELWYDVAGVAALQADAKDDAAVLQMLANTIRTLVDGGYEQESVKVAVTTGDLGRLVGTGLVSVQLLPPGTGDGGPNGVGAGTAGDDDE